MLLIQATQVCPAYIFPASTRESRPFSFNTITFINSKILARGAMSLSEESSNEVYVSCQPSVFHLTNRCPEYQGYQKCDTRRPHVSSYRLQSETIFTTWHVLPDSSTREVQHSCLAANTSHRPGYNCLNPSSFGLLPGHTSLLFILNSYPVN